MAYDFEKKVQSNTTDSVEIDLGLKAYMNKVYSFMAVGLALTGVIAHLFSKMAYAVLLLNHRTQSVIQRFG